MIARQRIAKWFLYLTCLVVLTCVTQRMVVFHPLQLAVESSNVSVNQHSINSDVDTTSSVSCKLGAKLLMAASPVMFEAVIFGLGMLFFIQSLLIVPRLQLRFPPPRVISPTTLRLHLRLCVFRE
ncbi:copper resistance protein [Serratia sp. DD3]|uniref:copper resistance protein n=1 Tax=Serratia sp. DD3 TaxID=1410619 RepID=UPI000907AF2B|nr:copper resistance protein [Serratia sp. DD3]